jgi:predicted SAM-dependent methyltransferase
MKAGLREWLKAHTSIATRIRLRQLQAGLQARFDEAVVRLARVVAPPRLPRDPDGRVYLNVGSGDVTHPTFINVDALVARHIHHIRPIDDLRPFADGSVDLVYASHCLEHFSYAKVPAVLAEWRRVLKPGGILRLGVPDFDRLLSIYEDSGRDMHAIHPILMGNQSYALNYHMTTFNKKSLTKFLVDAGFGEVRDWRRGEDELTSLPDFTGLEVTVGDKVVPISLNLEAVK